MLLNYMSGEELRRIWRGSWKSPAQYRSEPDLLNPIPSKSLKFMNILNYSGMGALTLG